MPNEVFVVRVHANNRAVLQDLFGTEMPDPKARIVIDGIEAMFERTMQRHGMSTEDIIITVILNFVTGVPASVLATWIYQRLARNGEHPVEVGDDPIVKVTQKEILEALPKDKTNDL